jgi:3-hydroxy-9,10-secoandrosta-1,3,5(10)-triene-9,17-dione monooxygenase reductase component
MNSAWTYQTAFGKFDTVRASPAATEEQDDPACVLAPAPGRTEPGFRTALGTFGTGVVVVTARHDGEPVGLTCNAFTAVSLDPPMVLFCPAKTSATWPRIAVAGSFCVNVLAESQQHVCASFARTGVDKFAGIDVEAASHVDAPRIAGALAHIECEIADVHEAGDHLVVLGRVLGLSHRNGSPLMFYGGAYGRFSQGIQRRVAFGGIPA